LVRANEFKKIESNVDCIHITFFKLNEFKQLTVQKKKRAWSTECFESETIKIHLLEEELWEFELLEWMCLTRNVQGKIAFEYNLSKVGVE
jgi:hypothetical protein